MTTTKQQSFLEKVQTRANLPTLEDAQRSSNVVLRILRDMLSKDASKKVEKELDSDDSLHELNAGDLWEDINVMVAFFSRISPLRPLKISTGTFWLRLNEEAALPETVDRKIVARAVFSALKEELSNERNLEISGFLPDEIRQIWQQA